jgi:hypothetical protein
MSSGSFHHSQTPGPKSENKTSYPKIFSRNARKLAGIFGEVLSQGTGALSDPMGLVGSMSNALFSSNPNVDWLGTKQRMIDLLSGKSLELGFNQALEALMPGARRSIEVMNNEVLSRSSPLGLRFSTDVLNQQRAGANDILLGTQNQALAGALQQMGMQSGLVSGNYDRQAQLHEGQLARQIPLLAQILSSTGRGYSTQRRSFSRGGSWGPILSNSDGK